MGRIDLWVLLICCSLPFSGCATRDFIAEADAGKKRSASSSTSAARTTVLSTPPQTRA